MRSFTESLERLMGAPSTPSNDLRSNLARGRAVVRGRQSEDQRNLFGGRDEPIPGGPTIASRQMSLNASHAADDTPMGDFFATLVGKESNLADEGKSMRTNFGGFGTLKAQDVPTGKVYNTSRGEIAPGLRGQGGWYTPEEAENLGQAGLSGLRRALGRR